MTQKAKKLAHAALIAALYAVLTHLQNLLLPGSASWAVQCRLSEALCVLALFTPAAISGLAVGCLLFNITFAAALPLDWLLGSVAARLRGNFVRYQRNAHPAECTHRRISSAESADARTF